MKALFTAFILYSFLLRCDDAEQGPEIIVCPPPSCAIPATVRDYSNQDCFFLLELNDGKLLAPYIIGYCGTPPFSDEQLADPLTNVVLKDGMKIRMDYQAAPPDAVQSPCTDLKTVRITCLTVEEAESDNR